MTCQSQIGKWGNTAKPRFWSTSFSEVDARWDFSGGRGFDSRYATGHFTILKFRNWIVEGFGFGHG